MNANNDWVKLPGPRLAELPVWMIRLVVSLSIALIAAMGLYSYLYGGI